MHRPKDGITEKGLNRVMGKVKRQKKTITDKQLPVLI